MRKVSTVDVAVVDTSNFKDIAIGQAVQAIDFAAWNGMRWVAAS